ncbi:Acetyl-CoA carboxylase, alpha subunit [gamma proteobacterium HdN1]|nr:Acetyl-CoA carboxylase, alpha subunit [gamma proteobacterium HdN1]
MAIIRPLSSKAMNPNYLEFEQPIAELESKIEELQSVVSDANLNMSDEIERLRLRSVSLTESIFNNLNTWQMAQMARHPKRPYTLDYLSRIFTDFDELHGDRNFGDDKALVCGLARLDGRPVVVIGHQKGRDVKEKVRRNFGMPNPEGYRKAMRLMQMAERFRLPVLTFIDTPGAYPGIEAEERGQSEAIARNLAVMASLKTPVIATVIGEGGSGGALAIGVCDRLLMMQYSTYSVISPEGCASILWKSSEYASTAAEAMGLTASRLNELGFVDEVVKEPMGGAHRDMDGAAMSLKHALLRQLNELSGLSESTLLDARYERLMSYGRSTAIGDTSSLGNTKAPKADTARPLELGVDASPSHARSGGAPKAESVRSDLGRADA